MVHATRRAAARHQRPRDLDIFAFDFQGVELEDRSDVLPPGADQCATRSALVLSDEETLLARFGRAIVADSNAVPTDIWAALKERYPPKTLVDLVAFAGIMIATAVFNNVVEVDFDPELAAFAEKDS
ncbi:hypothetical protein NXC24_PA00070 (plasmid) [Rhizobium sp. NXC24]|nr:hypothetical protein NXC24_PA00070 [Rhizobium sp. NXC24]